MPTDQEPLNEYTPAVTIASAENTATGAAAPTGDASTPTPEAPVAPEVTAQPEDPMAELLRERSKESLPQYARVDICFEGEPMIMHCPICGHATHEMCNDEPRATPCRHLAFIFIDPMNEFPFMSSDFESRCAHIDDKEVPSRDLQGYLRKAGYDNRFLAIGLCIEGMGCGGPWSAAEVYGFDYGTLAARDDSKSGSGSVEAAPVLGLEAQPEDGVPAEIDIRAVHEESLEHLDHLVSLPEEPVAEIVTARRKARKSKVRKVTVKAIG